ncbi:hypothetical protein PENTCL1PPCAC_7987, partial [Pristionchus entomophagus]
EAVVLNLALDILRIETMAVACANVSTGGDKRRMKDIFKDTQTRIERIAEHAIAWDQEALRNSWPQIG